MAILIFENFIWSAIVNNLAIEADIDNTTPEDFSLVVFNVHSDIGYEEKSKIDYVSIDGVKPLEVNMVYKLTDFFELSDKLTNINKKIRDIKKKLYLNLCKYGKPSRSKSGLVDKDNNKINDQSIDSLKDNSMNNLLKVRETDGCCSEIDLEAELSKLENEKMNLNSKLKQIIDNTNSGNSDRFSGAVILTFNTIEEYERYYDMFPQSALGSIFYYIKRFLTRTSKDFSKRSYQENLNLDVFDVHRAPEPSDIIWENLEFSSFQRIMRKLFVYFISIIMVGASFIIILFLNSIQNDSKNLSNQKLNYVISTVISISITIVNFIFNRVLLVLTNFEKNISLTDFHLNYSVKLTFITFLNTSVIPIVVNYLNGDWNNRQILLNNIITLFVSNTILTPILWGLDISYIFKKYKRETLIEKQKSYENDMSDNLNIGNKLKEQKINDESNNNVNAEDNFNNLNLNSNGNLNKSSEQSRNNNYFELNFMTQRELNFIFENPSIELSKKMAFLGQQILMSFFYLPLFPLGIIFSVFGVILAYIIEKVSV